MKKKTIAALAAGGALLLAAVTALVDALPVFGTGTVLLPWAAPGGRRRPPVAAGVGTAPGGSARPGRPLAALLRHGGFFRTAEGKRGISGGPP